MNALLLKKYFLPAILLLSAPVFSQSDTTKKNIPVTLKQYLFNVSKGNLGYIANQLNVNISEAALKASKVFPDPEISASYFNNEDKKLQLGKGLETGISYPVSLGNKRGANIALARSQYELAQITLDEYFRNLRADASLSYYQALKLRMSYQLQEDTYIQLKRIAQADSIRLAVGEANEIDAMQSALEAKAWLNQVYAGKAEMLNALVALSRIQGKALSDTLYNPSDEFPMTERNYLLPSLIENAIKNKEEIKIAIKNKEISEKNLRLLKANRAFEFNLQAGGSYNTVANNQIAPSPEHYSYNAGISIPLKFSSFNRGAIKAARFTIEQNETICLDVESQINTEVTQAYYSFMAKKKQVEHFNQGLIDSAAKILKGRLFSYQRGQSGLIDVLNAQHTYNNLRNDYLEALYDYTEALVELERASGIWDL